MRSVLLENLFRAQERRLWGLCYRLTGCAADADDLVQETFVRAAERHCPPDDRSWGPWLVRVATNLGVDLLRRRKRRGYEGSWLPSPIEIDIEAAPEELGGNPEVRYEQMESVSFAFLLALETLTPRQRAVLLLRDVLDYSASEAGEVLEMSEENVRITHHRARRAMRAYDRERCRPSAELHARTSRALQQLLRCLLHQDAAGLEALLTDSVRTIADGGGEYTALHGPIEGRAKVALLHLRVARRRAAGAQVELRSVNGLPALVIRYASAVRRQAPRAVLRCDVGADGRITALHTVLASRKLTAICFPGSESSAL